jgi:alpha-amylase/alpha-mannosidase (GH57 family)
MPSQFKVNPKDDYRPAPDRKPVYLNIIWHQHQPLYADPETDQLTVPWVRAHATKDYYDMAAILRSYPDIHCNYNLTSSLLVQIEDYYVRRLHPFVDVKRNRIDGEKFLAKWRGKTDPWIDLALKSSSQFKSSDKDFLYRGLRNCFSISSVILGRFPEYQALKEKVTPGRRPGDSVFTVQELRELKFWFYLAWFDPDFLRGPVPLEDGSVCDLSDYVALGKDGKYRLKKKISERDCQRMVVEAYKVMANVIPVHRNLRYDARARTGQIDVITTPYYHPILPLIYDSDLARICQPNDALPQQYSYPEDANAQVARAVRFYTETFGLPPTGMWPGEGSVAQPVLPIFRRNGIQWVASDVKVLMRSDPPNQPNSTAYQFSAGEKPIALVFRDTELSDRIGFKYQEYGGEEGAEDFVQAILSRAPALGEPDMLLTIILDGENAWEWYRKDNDGKEFLNALYRKLSKLYGDRRVITTTMSEYLAGNPRRGIVAHPVETLPAMKWLWPGSWINANYDTWIGEDEENRAWEYLLTVRRDLASSGLSQPDPSAPPPRAGTKSWYAYRAWESMYAAEGSDWFWWYGDDQTAPGGDQPFDLAFLTHLRNVYRFAQKAGAQLPARQFVPIIKEGSSRSAGQALKTAAGGTMAKSSSLTRAVVFRCDARNENVARGIFIAGSEDVLGAWKPNTVALRDDGRDGDERAGDGIWSVRVELPVAKEISYKFTNSGTPGQWIPGEEFSVRNRSLIVPSGSEPLIVSVIFGKEE